MKDRKHIDINLLIEYIPVPVIRHCAEISNIIVTILTVYFVISRYYGYDIMSIVLWTYKKYLNFIFPCFPLNFDYKLEFTIPVLTWVKTGIVTGIVYLNWDSNWNSLPKSSQMGISLFPY